MADLLTPSDVEKLAAQRGMTLRRVCTVAGVAYSTFGRWKRGATSPTLDVYRRIVAAVSPEPDAVEVANDEARRRGDAGTHAPVRHDRLPEAA
jgi:transcriptional regulator with XRE-family HTH domain